MSADAKVWFDTETMGGRWKGIHDGECPHQNQHHGTSYDLVNVLKDIEQCIAVRSLRWDFRTYRDGQVGLVGYVS